MAADLTLEQYVQRKRRGAREYFYFRVVRHGVETRLPLPHPFSADYRAAYDAAHVSVFGIAPNEFESPTAITALIRQHKDSARYHNLPRPSRRLRDYALDLMMDRWGAFDATAIRPVHVQALYDSLADRPATANRRLDDISAVFGWGRTRGFADVNPCARIERVQSTESREPWPDDALRTLIDQGQPHILRPALVAAYTGQRRGDVLTQFADAQIDGGVWYLKQSKTKTEVPVPLHPVILAIAETERVARRAAGIVSPRRPLLLNSRGEPWTGSGYGASWRTELIRLGLRPNRNDEYAADQFQPTFHGLRHTSATLIANTVARNPDLFGGIARVKSMLGHLTEAMAEHYSRRAQAEHMNTETMLLLPEIGNTAPQIGNAKNADFASD
ncbi:tyrosine-type recombinase/integrase [Oceaniglobus ichthyenteri]|uniref:tyrosine-type recombinase/integrase n=1 Tax=Oceaniglobus ichthyenteri TaxID=2136177 RepID=UPI000D3868BE|nr:tyrosine-type recombinase/integrase [Oceaniglobus ichthyenteri]